MAGPESGGWPQCHHRKGIIMSKRTTAKLKTGAGFKAVAKAEKAVATAEKKDQDEE